MQAKEITIRKAKMNDLPRLFEISSIVHTTNYTELIPEARKKDFFEYYEMIEKNRSRYISIGQRKINSPNYILLMATLDQNTIVGYLSGEEHDNNIFEIRSLFIDPSYQGKGIGTKLMDEIIKGYGSAPMYLKVIEGNRAAISLYEKYGFSLSQESTGKKFFDAQLLLMSRSASR